MEPEGGWPQPTPPRIPVLGYAAVQALLDAVPDAAVVADADGWIVLVNRQAGLLFGYDGGELLGQPVELLVPEAQREAHHWHRTVFEGGPRSRPMGTGLALSGRRKDGSVFPVDVSLGSLPVEGGGLVIAIVRDSAERMQVDDAPRSAAERLTRLVVAAERIARAASMAELRACLSADAPAALGASAVGVVLVPERNDAPGAAPEGQDAPALLADGTAAMVAGSGEAVWSETTAWLPMRAPGGVVGVLNVVWPPERPPAAEDRLAAATLAQQCAQAVERIRLGERADNLRADALAERELGLAVLDSVTDGFFVVDRDRRFIYVNRAAERLLGRTRGALIGRRVSEEATAIASGLFGKQLDWAADRRVVVGFEYEHRPNGQWYDVRGYPTPSGLFVYLRETTARKRAEEELRASEERFRLLVEGVRDHAIYLLDPDGRIASWNYGAERLSGHTPQDVLGQEFTLFFMDEDARAGVPRRLLDTATAVGAAEWEGWRMRKDGSRFWAHRAISALHDAQGNLRGFAVVTSDLTERHTAEEERAALLARLQEALHTRDQVLAGLAHDLRSPLAAIRAGADMMSVVAEQQRPDPAVLRRAAYIVRATADRMARWVDELHEASRLQVGGDLRLDREPFDLVGLVRSLVEEHQRLAPDHRLAVEAAEEEIVGHWDRGRVERVVDNLVGNAVKYSPAGRVVEIEVGQAEGWAILQVRDQGIGIPAADVPHLFDLFRRGSNVADRMPGSGIGLAVVRAAVERHGGTIEVASAPGVGSTFTVRLPLTGAVDNGSLPYR